MSDDNSQYALATKEDFDKFRMACDSVENWNVCYEESDGSLKVWDQKSEISAINIVKLYALFKGIDGNVLYDTLHDPDYRKEWDENMIEGYNITQLDANNDIGYYSAKAPSPVSNRDFVNQRSWMVSSDGKEFIIMNHTVIHKNAPEKKGFVRANSIMTGYMVRSIEGGCTLTYLTQTDPKGWIPAWLSNTVTRKFAPTIVGKLNKAASGYPDWKSKHNPDDKPWRASYFSCSCSSWFLVSSWERRVA